MHCLASCSHMCHAASSRDMCLTCMCTPAAGYDDVKTVLVLGSDPAVHKAQSKFLLGADLDLIVGKNSAVVQSDVSETQAIPYSMADGALLDISVKGKQSMQQGPLLEPVYNLPSQQLMVYLEYVPPHVILSQICKPNIA